ncbi:MAG: L-glyceraldehyde 3-phosphate reductase [Spartobacteria bacterium]|nr:L-glyceraldehyde 3-phosphate reductase [Spartobacteria bacterium]
MKIKDHAPIISFIPNSNRYDDMRYRRCGRSGVVLPALSLGLWHNFGQFSSLGTARNILRTAFDLGILHFDLANNYGPPYGSAEETMGQIMKLDFRPHRDELFISSKAGYDMWPGPFGNGGSRKYLMSSIDQSLVRMKLDYVDLFYHHCPDPDTPMEETIGALDSIVRQGKALYVGLSNYTAAQTMGALKIFNQLGTPCLIHQARYSMFDRWVEDDGLLELLGEEGIGLITFSPLAQGMLTNRYLNGIPKNSRAADEKSYLPAERVIACLPKIRQLACIADQRGQSLAQMALAWLLSDVRVTSVLIGASSPEQLKENVHAIEKVEFSDEEQRRIRAIIA